MVSSRFMRADRPGAARLAAPSMVGFSNADAVEKCKTILGNDVDG